MKWMKERDLLIAQTMAFVQSVTGKKPDALVPQVSTPKPVLAEAPPPVAEVIEPEVVAPVAAIAAVEAPPVVEIEAAPAATAVLAETPAPAPIPQAAPIPRLEIPADIKSEIKARVASFRAQQERFLREREEYSSTTMAKVRASLQEIAERRQSDK